MPASIAFPLIDGLRSETIRAEDRLNALVPIDPIGFDESVRLTLWEARGWFALEFRVEPIGDGTCSELTQTAYYRPMPFWGQLYWYMLYPLHWFIFRGMARNIARAVESPAARMIGV